MSNGAPLEDPITHRDVAYLANAIEGLTSVVNQLRVEMTTTYVRKDVLAPELASMKQEVQHVRDDVKGHDDWLVWATRIVIGVVVTAVITAAMLYKG